MLNPVLLPLYRILEGFTHKYIRFINSRDLYSTDSLPASVSVLNLDRGYISFTKRKIHYHCRHRLSELVSAFTLMGSFLICHRLESPLFEMYKDTRVDFPL